MNVVRRSTMNMSGRRKPLVGWGLDELQFTGVQLFFAGLQYDRGPGHGALPSEKTYREYMRLIGVAVVAKRPNYKPSMLEPLVPFVDHPYEAEHGVGMFFN